MELFFRDFTAVGVDDFAFDEIEAIGVSEGQIVGVSGEGGVPVVEEFDAADDLGTDSFETLDQVGELGGIGEFEEAADGGKGGVNGSAGDDGGEVGAELFDVEGVMEELVAEIVMVFGNVENGVDTENIGHGEEIEMEGVVADH